MQDIELEKIIQRCHSVARTHDSEAQGIQMGVVSLPSNPHTELMPQTGWFNVVPLHRKMKTWSLQADL